MFKIIRTKAEKIRLNLNQFDMKNYSCSNYTVPKLKLECCDEITLDPQYLHCVKAFPSPKIDNSFYKGVIKPSINIKNISK